MNRGEKWNHFNIVNASGAVGLDMKPSQPSIKQLSQYY